MTVRREYYPPARAAPAPPGAAPAPLAVDFKVRSISQRELAIVDQVCKKCFKKVTFSLEFAYDVLTLNRKYRLIEIAGEGSFGVIIKARYGSHDVVIKISKEVSLNPYIKSEAQNHLKLKTIVPDQTATQYLFCDLSFATSRKIALSGKNVRSILMTSFEGISLEQLFVTSGRIITIHDFVSIAYQLVVYCTTLSSKHTVQGDFTARNVLLSDNAKNPYSVKVIDTSDVFQEGEEIEKDVYFGRFNRTALFSRSPTVLSGKATALEMRFALGVMLFYIFTKTSVFSVDTGDHYVYEMTRYLQRVFKVLGSPTQKFLDAIPKDIFDALFTIDKKQKPPKIFWKYNVKDSQTKPGVNYKTFIRDEIKKHQFRVRGAHYSIVLEAVSNLISELLKYEGVFKSDADLLNCELFRLYPTVVEVHKKAKKVSEQYMRMHATMAAHRLEEVV